MKHLQMIKFGYQNRRLSFMKDLLCPERELSELNIPSTVLRDFLERNKLTEIEKLIEESWEGWGAEKKCD
jgi:hypothetical protein